jgi:hypothetical protein
MLLKMIEKLVGTAEYSAEFERRASLLVPRLSLIDTDVHHSQKPKSSVDGRRLLTCEDIGRGDVW